MSAIENSDPCDDPDQRASPSAPRPRGSPEAQAPGPAVSRESDELFTPAFVRLLGMQAAYGFSFSLFFLLPKYLASSGATPTQIGFVMGGFGVACVLTIPFLKPIVDRLGRRGALVAATLSLAAAGAAFAVLAPVGRGAIFLRASEGVAWTIMFSTSLVLTAEMAPRHRLAQAIGMAGAAALVMNAIAPAVGELIADQWGYRPVFLLAAIAAVVAAALARRLPDTEVKTLVPGGNTPAPDIVDAPAQRLRIYVVFGLSGLAFSSMFTFLAPFALAAGVQAIRPFFIAYTISALAVRILGGRMADRLGHRAIAAVSVTLYGLVVASTGVIGPHRLALLGFIFGLAHGGVFPSVMALLLNSTAVHRRQRVLGIANGAMSVGISAVFAGGMVVGRWGYTTMFAIAGGLVTVSAVLIARGTSADKR